MHHDVRPRGCLTQTQCQGWPHLRETSLEPRKLVDHAENLTPIGQGVRVRELSNAAEGLLPDPGATLPAGAREPVGGVATRMGQRAEYTLTTLAKALLSRQRVPEETSVRRAIARLPERSRASAAVGARGLRKASARRRGRRRRERPR